MNPKNRKIKIIMNMLIIVCLLAMIVTYKRLVSIYEMDLINTAVKNVEKTADEIDKQILVYENILRTFINDKRFQDAISNTDENAIKKGEIEEIRNLRNLVYHMEEYEGVELLRLYLADEKIITREGINFFPISQIKKEPEYERLSLSDGESLWFGRHQVKTKYFDEECVTLARSYKQLKMGKEIKNAYLMLDISPDVFSNLLDDIKEESGKSVIGLFDQLGNVITGDKLQVQNQRETTYDNHYASVSVPLKNVPWRLFLQFDRVEMIRNQKIMQITLILLIVSMVFIIIAVAAISTYLLISKKINDYIQNLSLQLQNEKNIEVQQFGLLKFEQNVDLLMDTNTQLVENYYEAKLREEQVKFQALQSQINPHFLYNTLDSLNWMALREGANSVAEAISTLADYFRLSLSRGESIVTLEIEIKIVKRYLELYNNRFNYNYLVHWDIDPKAFDFTLPKMTLQPFVENALFHGIARRKEKEGGILCIKAKVSDSRDRLKLEIIDNGPGIEDNFKLGYGIKNVKERLDIYCKGQYSISFEKINSLNVKDWQSGTRIVIVIEGIITEDQKGSKT